MPSANPQAPSFHLKHGRQVDDIEAPAACRLATGRCAPSMGIDRATAPSPRIRAGAAEAKGTWIGAMARGDADDEQAVVDVGSEDGAEPHLVMTLHARHDRQSPAPGTEVPMATTVAPMTNSERPMALAMPVAPNTISLPAAIQAAGRPPPRP